MFLPSLVQKVSINVRWGWCLSSPSAWNQLKSSLLQFKQHHKKIQENLRRQRFPSLELPPHQVYCISSILGPGWGGCPPMANSFSFHHPDEVYGLFGYPTLGTRISISWDPCVHLWSSRLGSKRLGWENRGFFGGFAGLNFGWKSRVVSKGWCFFFPGGFQDI